MTEPLKPFKLEFYEDPDTGRFPVHEWIKTELTPYQRRALGAGMDLILQMVGKDVCESEYGKNLGGGLYEFGLRQDSDEIIAKFTKKTPDDEPDASRILLRVFFHPHRNHLLLLLAGYDKGKDPSDRREDKEIQLARKRLTQYKSRKGGLLTI